MSEELFHAQDYDSARNYNHKDDPFFGEKIGHEIHRIMGLLRFTPDEDGVFVARCAPDYYVLPALGPYFTERFGDTPWEIIDEKRGLSLSRKIGEHGLSEKPVLSRLSEESNPNKDQENKVTGCHCTSDTQTHALIDEWEELWKNYHKTINNESRDNPDLQRQLMPKRYWKYLPEKC